MGSVEIIDPSLVLATMEDVRAAVDGDMRVEWTKQLHEFAFRIRSEWLVSLIGEITAREYPYNAVVKREAWLLMGMSPATDDFYYKEGDTLSLLVYNAQCFRRSDEARVKEVREAAEGWIRPTQEWLAARVGKQVEVLRAKNLGRVVELSQGRGCVVRPHGTRSKVFILDEIKVRDA